jgi:regulator of protease activity HflC (stomatin/prohibitin superfamily)
MSKSPTETSGWRAGKPVEDPEKIKPWGFISAKPSEYLVHVRRGKVLMASSGQGASCFKRPRDAVAIVPTSLQQLRFQADQVTLERVGVEVVGLAVYRIADPLLAYRVLNFSYPERAQQKLEETLSSMCVGAVRRLVANLTVDECLQKRKSAIAQELQRELAPVVGGEGRPDDDTDRGWGVVIDTIEIQEVRVLSDKVFAAMQAPYRTALDQRAREAKAQADKEIAAREAQYRRETELARLDTEKALQERRLLDEQAAAEALAQAEARRRELAAQAEARKQELEAQARNRQQELEAQGETQHHELAAQTEVRRHELAAQTGVRRRELESVEAEAELAALARRSALLDEQARHDRARARLDAELRRLAAETRLAEGQHDAEVTRLQGLAELPRAEAQARLAAAQNLPQLAAALGQRVGNVQITQLGSENPFGSIAQAIHAVIDLAHSASAARKDG